MKNYRLQAFYFSFQSARSHQPLVHLFNKRSFTPPQPSSRPNYLLFTSPFRHHPSEFASSRRIQTSAMASQTEYNLVVDSFCYRQFSEKENSKGYLGTVFDIPINEFEEVVNSRFDPSNLQSGYAPFCKHIFIRNDFTGARVNVLPITDENEHCLRSKYEARNEKELPVLTRYFSRELLEKNAAGGNINEIFPVAKYLDLILYSREQINKENEAMGKSDEGEVTAPWGIVSIKAQDIDKELPMTPITAMRNALGKEEGGSGVPIDRAKYMEAFQYWKDHATVV